jgi:hypothetical protein
MRTRGSQSLTNFETGNGVFLRLHNRHGLFFWWNRYHFDPSQISSTTCFSTVGNFKLSFSIYTSIVQSRKPYAI